MAAAELRDQFNAHLGSMYATGILDAYFQELQASEDEGFIAEVIDSFLHDAEWILEDIAVLLKQPKLDMCQMDILVHRLKGSSSSVGARKVSLACLQFRQFYNEKNEQGCLTTLSVLRSEYCDVRNKLQTLMQLEQQIAALGPDW